MEKWKIQSNIEKIERGGNTNFLNKKDIHTITKILDKRNVKYQVFVPYEEAEKQIIYGKQKNHYNNNSVIFACRYWDFRICI